MGFPETPSNLISMSCNHTSLMIYTDGYLYTSYQDEDMLYGDNSGLTTLSMRVQDAAQHQSQHELGIIACCMSFALMPILASLQTCHM